MVIQPSFDIRVPDPPRPVTINRKANLVYELHCINFSNVPLLIKKIEVLDSKNSSVVSVFREDEIINRLYKPCDTSGEIRSSKINPGCVGIIYIEIVIENLSNLAGLQHKINFQTKKEDSGKYYESKGAFVKIASDPVILLGAPLAGGPWVAIHEPSWERGHRRVIYTADGKARIPGRFAIDFIKLDDIGMVATGERNVIKNWYGYGVDVVAVADGTISTIRNDFPESPVLSEHPAYNSSQATGNYISMEIGKNKFVFYEHLKPGSIRVKPGQRVKKGDVIANLGFTGQTTGPHLHIHVADADSPLGAEGLPFAFESFMLLGSYSDFTIFEKARWQDKNQEISSKIINERPAPNTVISFR